MPLSPLWEPLTSSLRALWVSKRRVWFVLAALLIWPGLAQAELRVALVIGNGAYVQVGELDNPVNDARDISAALEDMGFEVSLGTDLSLDAMRAVVQGFATKARGADVALFYYAGHAFQIDTQNYLVPVDLRVSRIEDVVGQTMSLNAVMDVLQQVPGLRLVFLDACRDNPLNLSGSGGGGGLARVGSAADFHITYATQPDAVAYDGDGRNGTFTEALLSHIRTTGVSLAEMMISVRKDVISATGGQQVPWENSSLTREFKFVPGAPAASADTILYQIAARSGDPQLMQLYLDRFPEGAHVREVVAFLAAAAGGRAGTEVRGVGGDRDEGEELWQLAQRTRLRQLFESYLELHPGGPHADSARQALAELPSEDELGPGRTCERLATHPRDQTAATAGVPFDVLVRNATRAIDACTAATAAYPDMPRYLALLARAKAAAGLRGEAVELYRQAADRGDLRAMVSLALLTETGDGVAKDPAAALRLYERAAAEGSLDAAINLAVALYTGAGVPRDVPRAIGLMVQASSAGSAIATFNLGVLAQEGGYGTLADALPLFERAAREGERRAYRAAAVLLDEGRGVARDPERAAIQLLLGAAADDGTIVANFTASREKWTRDTLRAMQRRLKTAGLYEGGIDGVAGPRFSAALTAWRNGGFDQKALLD